MNYKTEISDLVKEVKVVADVNKLDFKVEFVTKVYGHQFDNYVKEKYSKLSVEDKIDYIYCVLNEQLEAMIGYYR